MESVRDHLEKLQFRMQIPQVMYLNRDRVDTLFVATLGSVQEFTQKAGTSLEGTLGVKFGFLGVAEASASGKAGHAGEASVTYTLDKPIAQALVLEATLAHSGAIKGVDAAQRGEYVSATGIACCRRPNADPPGYTFDELHRPWCLKKQDNRFVRLEQKRALQEFDSQGREYWLLVLQEEDGMIVAASVADASWFDRNTWSSYQRAHLRTAIFGILESKVEEIPLISPMLIMLEPT